MSIPITCSLFKFGIRVYFTAPPDGRVTMNVDMTASYGETLKQYLCRVLEYHEQEMQIDFDEIRIKWYDDNYVIKRNVENNKKWDISKQ